MPCATIWFELNTASTADRAVASSGWPPTLICGPRIFEIWAGLFSEQRLFPTQRYSPGCLRRAKQVAYRLRECYAKPDFPGPIPGSSHPNCDTMLFPWMKVCGPSSAGWSKPPSIAPMIRARRQPFAHGNEPNCPQSTLWPPISDRNRPVTLTEAVPVLVSE